ncbi:carbon-nitrogen hydrolase [Saccharata proteae CBS 121410]|uniref:Carbon-nitrogen hydrolase n=1 Tax=Saccharata proteae CBS 121410 TaxID=1314787 RepID=A0A9P4HRW6_9PEZI|nr:carbon-nitrogen hydrolase [Saccharata proteae CBS 121410]
MKVAILQYAPTLGAVPSNISRVESLITQAQQTNSLHSVDWLVLPELALTGYNFPSLASIAPYLEPTAAGTTTQWAQRTALRLRCHVTAGYPEVTSDGRRFNSTVTVAPSGEVLVNYRKTFLYYTDETWAEEGDRRFFSGPVGALGQVSLGICMDLNPHRFLAPWADYEFATSALLARTPLISLSMAWLTRHSPADIAAAPLAPDQESIAYWLERLEPLLNRNHRTGPTYPIFVVLANRCGSEGGVTYAGTSCVLKIERNYVGLYEAMGQGEERVMVVDLDQVSCFSLLFSSGKRTGEIVWRSG